MSLIDLAERGLVPDALVRLGIRRLLKVRLDQEHAGDVEAQSRRQAALMELMNGRHYALTARAWLEGLDARRSEVKKLFDEVYGAEADRWVQRWRMFFMACEELFAFRGGNEWLVAHYLFKRR